MGLAEFAIIAGVCLGVPTVFGVLVWSLLSAAKQRQQRLDTLATWARTRGLTWCPGDPATKAAAQRFRFAARGRAASTFWVARGGTDERQLCFFPYANVFEATLTIGRSRPHVSLSNVCVLWTPASSAPEFVLRRRSNSTDLLAGRIDLSSALFDGKSVAFPEDELFSREWVVAGDEVAMRTFFTAERRRLVSELNVFVIEQHQTSLAVLAGGDGQPEQLEALEHTANRLRASWV